MKTNLYLDKTKRGVEGFGTTSSDKNYENKNLLLEIDRFLAKL